MKESPKTVTLIAVDRVLDEVDFQMGQLDKCVERTVLRMMDVEDGSLLKLVEQAQDANRKASILAELKILLLDLRQKEGGDAPVPQAVLDLIEMGRVSCSHHIQQAFGKPCDTAQVKSHNDS